MEWAGPIRQRNIDIAEGLYNEFKAGATRYGMRLYEAFPQALEEWLQNRGLVPKRTDGDRTKGELPEEGNQPYTVWHQYHAVLDRILSSKHPHAEAATAYMLSALGRLTVGVAADAEGDPDSETFELPYPELFTETEGPEKRRRKVPAQRRGRRKNAG